MAVVAGTYVLGPEQGRLSVHTGKTGAAARAGHNLLIEVGRWSATLEVGAQPGASRLQLTADARSLRVLDGSGGMTALDDGDKASIAQTIDDEVLRGTTIAFRSNDIREHGDTWTVGGELELAGTTRPLSFELTAGGDGVIRARAVVTQSEWGIKPYSALFGTLKVTDDVEVTVDAELPSPAERKNARP